MINDDIQSSLKKPDNEVRQHNLKLIKKHEALKQNRKGLQIIQDNFETFGKQSNGSSGFEGAEGSKELQARIVSKKFGNHGNRQTDIVINKSE